MANPEQTPEDTDQSIPWHPAFIEALKMELEEYEDVLEFLTEFQLTSEPLRIDCVVVKKAKDIVIKKNIAVIFRKCNIVEFKSPDDYVSVEDFYKVYGYACLYASFEKTPITDLTITFVESRYSKKLLDHLKKERGYKVVETCPGIYTISGDILPIQVIDSRKLPVEENLWLRGLNNGLKPLMLTQVSNKIRRQGKAVRLKAYLYAIVTANYTAIKEAEKKMNTFDRLAIETGLAAKWEAEGEARGEARGEVMGMAKGREAGRAEERAEVARNALAQGLAPEFVQKITGLDMQTITSFK
jgi:hypothetical protein